MGILSDEAIKNASAMFKQSKISSENNSDEQAYETYELYDDWERIPEGTFLKEGKRIGHKGVLYKVNSPGHNKQATWTPDTAASLFTPIPKNQDGTSENPITWVSGMVSEAGKYYSDEGIIYLCIESSGTGLYAQPKDLPRYFKVYKNN